MIGFRFAGGVSLLIAAAFMHLSSTGAATAALQHAGAAHLATFAGRDFNGLCCSPKSGALCATAPLPLAQCGSTLPHGCSCTGAVGGPSFCQILTKVPEKHDVCTTPRVGGGESNCTLTHTYCYLWTEGDCDHDGGPWSILGFCTTCGCVQIDPTPQLGGTRSVCLAGSTGC